MALLLKQFYLNCLAHASYIVADTDSRAAAVVDPQRDIEQYVAFAEAHGLTLAHVILTHFHADFVAGHLELRDRAGAAIYLGAEGRAEYAFTPLGDGDTIALGPGVRLQAIHTPGHTAESISIAVYDLAISAQAPNAVLTGDTLFIGDVGRPDLRVALGWSASDLGSMLYDSLHRKLLTLPDASLVYPAHGAGSLCGKALSKETVSTIGEQRRVNYALQPMSREAFIDIVTADQPEAPAYFTYDAVLNTRERPTLDETMERGPLTLEHVLAMQAVGAQIVDTREAGDFASAHLIGSINIGLGGQFATWAGTLLDRDHPIVIVAEPGREREAVMRLGRIGFDHVAGYLADGMLSVWNRPDLTASTERVSPGFAFEQIESDDPPFVLDVRTPAEHAARSIRGSVCIPLSQLGSRLHEIPRGRRVLVHCAGGYRSSAAASLLQRERVAVIELTGGIAACEAAGLRLERDVQA